MRTDRFALADLGQQDRLDEIVTDAARGLEDTFDVNERSNKGRLRKRKTKHAKPPTKPPPNSRGFRRMFVTIEIGDGIPPLTAFEADDAYTDSRTGKV